MKKLLSLVISAALALSAGIAVSASDIGECKGEVPKIDAGIITVDGVKDSAYEQGLKVDINQFNTGTETGTYGIAYMLWADGSYYLLVEVHDADVQQPSADAQANTPWTTDSVEIFFDFGNEAVNLAEQFRIDCTGYPSYYIQGGAYYAYGPEDAAEYFDDYAAAKTDDGYNIEMRVNLKEAVEAYELKEGDSIGLQLQINDMTAANTSATTALYNMASSLLAGSWDVDRYDYITLGDTITATADAPAADTEAESSEAAYIDYTSTDVIAESTGAFATVEEAAASIGRTPITSGYTFVAGTDSFANEEPKNLFDNDTATKFCTGEFPTLAVAKLDTPVTVDGVIMATANDNANNTGRNPFEWAVFVSADGENWTQLVYGDDMFFEDVNFTYYGTAVTPVENVQYVQFQSEGALSGCFQMSELVLCGTASAAPAATAEEPASEPEETVATEPETAPETESADETVEAPETPVETTAPQTFDMGVIAAVCAVISAAGYAASKKRR